MPEVTVKMISELRERTGAGMMDCKKALVEVSGEMEKAIDFLRKKGLATAAKKAARAAEEGIVASYIHHNSKVGVLIELKCETDFVARTDQFRTLASEIAMHVAWANPVYVSKEDVPQAELDREMAVEKERAKSEGKPEAILERIVQGRLAKFYERVCLLEQPFIRDDSKKVRDVIAESVAKVGENIVVGKLVRMAIGEH
jgi:elongation factor Ts